MRVWYSFPLRIGRSGIGETAIQQVRGIAEHGATVTLWCGSLEAEAAGVARVVETNRPAGFRLPMKLMGLDRWRRWHDGVVAKALRKAPANLLPDVVHAWPLGALETIRAAQARGVAVVLERPNAHTAFAYSVVEAESRKLGVPVSEDNPHHADPARLAREEAEYDAADALLCPSDFVRQTFVDQGVSEAKLVRHRYGYDAARFKPAELNGHEPGGLRALFAGRCEPRKGLHYALEAWAKSGVGEDGGTLTLCGVFEPAFREACAKWLELPGVDDAGFVTDIETRMRNSDALVLPSIEEGSALVTYEARACGCLLLVSDAAGAVVADGADGLLHRPGDVAALAEHYRRLHDDPALRRRMRAASAAVAADLTWSAAGARLLEAYAETIDRARPVAR